MAKTKGQWEFVKWMGPLLDALRELGGSATPRECSAWIAKSLKLADAVTEARIHSGAERFHHQVRWARQYLVWEGLLDARRRGIWTLTPKGAEIHLSFEDSRKIALKWARIHGSHRSKAHSPEGSDVDSAGEQRPAPAIAEKPATGPSLRAEEEEQTELLDVLQSLSPSGFERLSKRLLHEYGLEQVVVTGRSHDGGIDGHGVLRLNPLITMRVSFQCKRIRKDVSRSQVGDFRNAVMGRSEKGLFITTGWFTGDAEREANREGVIQIELIDGEKLVELCEAKEIGLRRKEIFEVDYAFFEQFR